MAPARGHGRLDRNILGPRYVLGNAARPDVGVRDVAILLGLRPGYPLANYAGPVPTSALQQHVQLVLTDRTDLSQGRESGVISEQTWRLADLGAKHAFLRGGLGWGHMPMPMVEVDLARGTLVEIVLQDAPRHRRIADVRGLPRRRTAAPGRTVADRPPPDRPGGGSAP